MEHKSYKHTHCGNKGSTSETKLMRIVGLDFFLPHPPGIPLHLQLHSLLFFPARATSLIPYMQYMVNELLLNT